MALALAVASWVCSMPMRRTGLPSRVVNDRGQIVATFAFSPHFVAYRKFRKRSLSRSMQCTARTWTFVPSFIHGGVGLSATISIVPRQTNTTGVAKRRNPAVNILVYIHYTMPSKAPSFALHGLRQPQPLHTEMQHAVQVTTHNTA